MEHEAMHRLIVTSSTFRMASTSDPADAAIDKDKHVSLAHADVALWSGGGPGLPLWWPELGSEPSGPDIDSKKGLTVSRRSIYFRHAAEKRMEFLTIFDGPGVTECYERRESVMPQQALALSIQRAGPTASPGPGSIFDEFDKRRLQALCHRGIRTPLFPAADEEESTECLAYFEAACGERPHRPRRILLNTPEKA